MKLTHTAGASLLTAGIVAAAVGLGGGAASAAGNTFIVGSTSVCPSANFQTIQAAVDAASSGDTIMVCAGTYGEHVDISTPDLTLKGAQSGIDARGRKTSPTKSSTVSNTNGPFTIDSAADGTTIDGFVITGANSGNADGVADFQGSSGLTLINNVIQLNGNGLNIQNPDGSQPALISQNNFINNSVGAPSAMSGSGIFISNGPADNTTIANNSFSKHSETAINFAGDSNNLSTGLQVYSNRSTDDSTFVVATNSAGAVIDDNSVKTSANAPGGHGTGILDFGGNSNLRISNNIMKATGTTDSSGISVSNYGPNSMYTTVVGNTISGWYNDLKIVTGNTSAYVSGNKLSNAQNDGIIVQTGVSGVVLTHNTATTAANFACEDQTTGSGTSGTANTWTKDHGATSSPVGICS